MGGPAPFRPPGAQGPPAPQWLTGGMPDAPADLGVLLLGYGLAGRVFHAPLIRPTPGLAIRAIVTADPQRQAQARADVPEAAVVATVDEALERDDLDLAVVATANATHVPLAMRAIDRGLHVVVDKPLAPTAHQAQAVIDAAAEMGVQVHPFQNRRWDSDFLTLVAAADELGSLHRLETRIERMRPQLKGSWRESGDPEQLGGVLFDFGAHLVDQAIILLGPVRSVTAHASRVRDANGAEDDSVMLLRHEGGAVSWIVGSMIAAFGDPRFTLLGSAGGIRISASDTQEDHLKAGRFPQIADGPDDAWGIESAEAELVTVLDGEPVASRRELERGRWDAFYPAVRDAIRGVGSPPVPAQDVVANLRVLEAAAQSVRTGTEVVLHPSAAHAR